MDAFPEGVDTKKDPQREPRVFQYFLLLSSLLGSREGCSFTRGRHANNRLPKIYTNERDNGGVSLKALAA